VRHPDGWHEGDIEEEAEGFFDEPAGNISASLPVFKGRRYKVHMPFQCPPWFPRDHTAQPEFPAIWLSIDSNVRQ
jgi:hypothetical protein